jgi:glucokinase
MAQGRQPVLALDIGGTKLAAAVMTEDGALHGYTVEPTRREEGPDAIIPRLFALGRGAMDEARSAGLDDIAAVGVSCGGPLDATRGILTNPLHLPGWIGVPIVDLASREFGVAVALENDASAGALGEYRYGASQGEHTALYLTISTGIGGGAVIDGRLHRGAAGNGGEFGHIMVRPGGRECLCGRRGCLEAYASGTSIAARATDALARSSESSSLRDLERVTAADVSSAASHGDELATRIWDETTDVLSIAITDLVNVFEPDTVVLGGGVTRSGEALLGPVREAVLREAMRPAAAKVNLALTVLGDAVCVVGAGALAFDLAAEAAHV